MPEVKIYDIANILIKDSVTVQKKVELADTLQIPLHLYTPFLQQHNIGITSVYDFFVSILSCWVSANGDSATVHNLCSILTNVDLILCSEKIQKHVLSSIITSGTLPDRRGSLLSVDEEGEEYKIPIPKEIEKNLSLLVAFIKQKKIAEAFETLDCVLNDLDKIQEKSIKEQIFTRVYDIGNCRMFRRNKYGKGKIYFGKVLKNDNADTCCIPEVLCLVQSKYACCLEETGDLQNANEFYHLSKIGFNLTSQDRYANETEESIKRVNHKLAKERKTHYNLVDICLVIGVIVCGYLIKKHT